MKLLRSSKLVIWLVWIQIGKIRKKVHLNYLRKFTPGRVTPVSSVCVAKYTFVKMEDVVMLPVSLEMEDWQNFARFLQNR